MRASSTQMRCRAPGASTRSLALGSRSGGAARPPRPSPTQRQPADQQQPHHQQQQHGEQHQRQPGRRGALLSGLALATSALTAPRRAAAAAAPPAAESSQQSAALEEYMQSEAKGKLKDKRALDDFRWGS
jgi:hypothetical protein